MTTTKQGLRNLDGPQRNARVVTKDEACIHDYRHLVECIACCAWDPLAFRHDYRCAKCGKETAR